MRKVRGLVQKRHGSHQGRQRVHGIHLLMTGPEIGSMVNIITKVISIPKPKNIQLPGLRWVQ
jgi:hypothetical protein